MAMALDPITAGLDLASTIVGKIWPDKSAQEQAQLSAVLSMITAQTDIDKAEASNPDPLEHWRGGLGWVCVLGYFWNFFGEPVTNAVAVAIGHPMNLPPMDLGQLSTLTLGMLGLGGMHAWQTVNSK
jgi:hypothetical protein